MPGGRGQHAVAAGDLSRRTRRVRRSRPRRRRRRRPTAATPRCRGGRPTAATAASMTLSTAAASASAPSCRPPRLPPRTLVPSRVPSASSTVTCLTQPSPSSQVFVTRSAMYAGPLAGRAEHRAQLVVDRVGEHRAERLVGAGQLGDLRLAAPARSASAAPSMAPRFSSEPRSTSSWLRREDAPSVIDSMESSGSIWSMRILADSAISASVASAASNAMSSGRGPPDGAAGAAAGAGAAAAAAAPPAAAAAGVGVLVGSGSGSVSVANSTAASRSALSTSTVLWRVLGQLQGVGGQTGDRRRGLHADLDEPLDAETAGGLLDEQQILGLDPAHRAGELPGQQFDDDLAAQLARPLVDARCRSRRGSRRAARRAPDRGSPG